jgi:hypothetical protein
MRFRGMSLPLQTSISGCSRDIGGHCFQLYNIKKMVKIQFPEVAHHAAVLDLSHF